MVGTFPACLSSPCRLMGKPILEATPKDFLAFPFSWKKQISPTILLLPSNDSCMPSRRLSITRRRQR